MLEETAILLLSAVLVVPIFKKFGLGSVLGYLITGILIGPWFFGFITNIENILHFSELGVVFLLFVIGLELQPARLWVLRRLVFGLGSLQMASTAIAITLIAFLFIKDWATVLIIGFAAAMSSTAFILQTLVERGELSTRFGRDAFAVLLFQDLAVIPLLAIIPLMVTSGVSGEATNAGMEILRALVVIAVMVTIGRQLLRLLIRGVAYYGNREIFTATALLIVLGVALLMNYIGVSMSIGAFIAGVLLADSEYRHQLIAEIEPFKGLLLGLFFIAVGMSVNVGLLINMPFMLIGLAILLIIIKFMVMYSISLFQGNTRDTARNLGITLSTGGEFAFILFSLSGQVGLMNENLVELLIMIITLSMVLSPLLFLFNDKILAKYSSDTVEPEYDRIDEVDNAVVIIGFGRVGQIVSRILHMSGITFTALENNPSQVDFVRKFGSKIYYGDATRLDLLRAARIDKAKLVVLCINDIETSMKTVNLLRQHYPNITIYARAHNRLHCYKLMDQGIKILFRDTFYSTLKLSTEILKGLGMSSDEAEHTVDLFRKHDEALLQRQHAIYQDENALIESVVKSRAELQTLFESDITQKSDKNISNQ